MLLSSGRAIVATCVAITICVISLTFFKSPPTPNIDFPKNTFQGLRAYWTSEKLEQRFGYVQYATDLDYLCNAMINFVRLQRFAVEYDLVLIYPQDWDEGRTNEAKWIQNIRSDYPRVKLRPFKILSTNHGDPTWQNSLTKFHAFALNEYSRVLVFDSDSTVQNNMDHYFLAPLAPVAVPRAYWLTGEDKSIKSQILGSHVMLIEPNEGNYKRIIDEATSSGDFDMEVLNHLFSDSAMILPHRRLALLTGEFRNNDHQKYMVEDKDEVWNAHAELSRAYLVHFSDWPLPKPWKHHTDAQWNAALPACPDDDVETRDRPRCADRSSWTSLYEDYYYEKDKVCGALSR